MGALTSISRREHRISPTAPILAWAYVPGKELQPCAIVNYTREGACVSSAVELPNAFCLRTIDSPIERMCLVVWRDEGLLGVRYTNVRTVREAVDHSTVPSSATSCE
jgi:hypothetical protein